VNIQADSVSIIDIATNTITANVDVRESEGLGDPIEIAIISDRKKVYVTKSSLKNAAVIDTATNTVIGTVTVENYPSTFGKFIGGNIQKAKLNGSKAKASFSKYKDKQKNHSKHHKAKKNHQL
jgi:YVTN family beta-propeller protein